MGILVGLIQQVRHWDQLTRLSFVIALILFMLALAILTTSEDLRTPAMIATAGLLVAMQVIALWGNRHLVTPYTQAQRHFLAGDLVAARDTLLADLVESDAHSKRPAVDSLVLLGNVYRNLGMLDESARYLEDALSRKPSYHFALYGVGRTLLVSGKYEAAMQHIAQAIEQGAPPIVYFDLVHAAYRAGDAERAARFLQDVPENIEPYQQLLLAYIQQRLVGSAEPAKSLVEAGLTFWEAEAQRFQQTAYGKVVHQDVLALREML